MGVLQQGMKGERMARKVEGRNNSFSYKKWGGGKGEGLQKDNVDADSIQGVYESWRRG